MPANFYGGAYLSILNKEIDFEADSLKLMLVTGSYVFSALHRYKVDITNEVTGGDYVAGGVAVTNPAVTFDNGTGIVTLNADDVTFTNGNYTFRYAILYDDTPATDLIKPVIMAFDAGSTNVAGLDLVVTFAAAGLGTITLV